MYQKFDENTKKILKRSKLEMQKLKHPFVGTEHLILSILSFNDLDITKRLKEYKVTYDNFKIELLNILGIGNSLNSYFIYTPLLKRVIENAIIDAKEENILEVNPNILFLSILEEGEGVGIKILNTLGVDIDLLLQEFENKTNGNIQYKFKKKLLINEHAVNLIDKAKNGNIDLVVGRDKEINRLIEILLRKNKNNPLLIGEAGVGKTAIVEALALKIYKKDVPDELLNKQILSISMANLVAGTKYRGEFEERIEKMIKEIEMNPNLIIFIDEIHSIVGAGGAEGAIDAANILKPALARGKFKLIGATTINEYKETIEKDKALNRRFQTILIKEPNLEETKNILTKIKNIYENYHQVTIPSSIINNIVNLSDKYIFDRKNPDKSIDVLDEVCTRRSLIKDKNTNTLNELQNKLNEIQKLKNEYIVNHNFSKATNLKMEELEIEDKINKLTFNIKNKNKKIVTMDDVASVIKSKTNIPVYEIDKESIKELKKLDFDLKHHIVGQDEVIKKICSETYKIKLGYKDSNRPTSFLFVGSSGVGKTELVKKYSNILNMNLIRIDASEYKESHTISKIIGSPPGYIGYDNHSILDDIKNNPYSVILVDEIDKSCKSFQNIFLQILDEGFITNSSSEKIYFNHAIIIMTSNKVSNNNQIGFNNNDVIIKDDLKENFNIEFLNRINYIIKFNDLNEEDIRKIIKKEINFITNKFKLQGIELNVDKKFVNNIIDLSDYKNSGARKIKLLLEDKIDNIVIDNLLNGIKKIDIK